MDGPPVYDGDHPVSVVVEDARAAAGVSAVRAVVPRRATVFDPDQVYLEYIVKLLIL